jgi:hypothetical protein
MFRPKKKVDVFFPARKAADEPWEVVTAWFLNIIFGGFYRPAAPFPQNSYLAIHFSFPVWARKEAPMKNSWRRQTRLCTQGCFLLLASSFCCDVTANGDDNDDVLTIDCYTMITNPPR